MGFTVIRAGDRSRTTTVWLTSHHSFSFGDHYDPSNTHHGVLLAFNEELLATSHGFSSHRHHESEIVTWVVSGTLVHRDSAGNAGVVYPGLAQRLSAGAGVDHTERNDPWPDLPGSGTRPVHYIQMWVAPDRHGIEPSYAQRDVTADLASGELVAVASGDEEKDAALSIANRAATLYAARLPTGGSVTLPSARFTHLFVVDGTVAVSGDRPQSAVDLHLSSGDALRGTDTGGEAVTTDAGAEILVWAMDTALGEG
ncbi:pirin-like bicupin family protein [Gordonia sinesedis]